MQLEIVSEQWKSFRFLKVSRQGAFTFSVNSSQIKHQTYKQQGIFPIECSP